MNHPSNDPNETMHTHTEAPRPALPKLPPKIAKAARALQAQNRRHLSAIRKLNRKTSAVYNKVQKAADHVTKLSSAHNTLLRQADRLNTSAELARQPLVLALHKACTGTGVDVFDLIQKLNEHNNK